VAFLQICALSPVIRTPGKIILPQAGKYIGQKDSKKAEVVKLSFLSGVSDEINFNSISNCRFLDGICGLTNRVRGSKAKFNGAESVSWLRPLFTTVYNSLAGL
jgi:hypothetical protein